MKWISNYMSILNQLLYLKMKLQKDQLQRIFFPNIKKTTTFFKNYNWTNSFMKNMSQKWFDNMPLKLLNLNVFFYN